MDPPPKWLWMSDQLKAMRQDLTVQRIRNDLTAAVYESHARAALEPFAAAGQVSFANGWLRLERGSAPYARAIAAVFDAYRTTERSFSSAI